jgi:hypothetical protein
MVKTIRDRSGLQRKVSAATNDTENFRRAATFTAVLSARGHMRVTGAIPELKYRLPA